MSVEPATDSLFVSLAVRSLRKEKKLSQRRLSWAAGVSEDTIYLLEFRRTSQKLVTLEKIAKALNTTVEGLIVKGKELHEPVPKTARQILSENVKEYRKVASLSQEMLAYRSGVSVQTVVKVEAARTSATIDTIWNIAATLGIPASLLLDDLDSKS